MILKEKNPMKATGFFKPTHKGGKIILFPYKKEYKRCLTFVLVTGII
jgi:hypothetical protein